VEGTVREVKRRVRVVASSYRAIDRSVTKWIVVTMVEWSSEVRWELVPKTGCSRSRLDDRSFTAAGPRLWNNLPVHLRVSVEFPSTIFCPP